MGHYNAHAAGPSSAHLAHDFAEEDDYYNANLSAAPIIDQHYNVEFGDTTYDSARGDADYCCISILEDEQPQGHGQPPSRTNEVHAAYLTKETISDPQMANLTKLPIVQLPKAVDHWVELCSGGMIAGLSAALANGVQVNMVTIVEKSRMVRFMATHRLEMLSRQCPTQV